MHCVFLKIILKIFQNEIKCYNIYIHKFVVLRLKRHAPTDQRENNSFDNKCTIPSFRFDTRIEKKNKKDHIKRLFSFSFNVT